LVLLLLLVPVLRGIAELLLLFCLNGTFWSVVVDMVVVAAAVAAVIVFQSHFSRVWEAEPTRIVVVVFIAIAVLYSLSQNR
jgi:hypothetical protein